MDGGVVVDGGVVCVGGVVPVAVDDFVALPPLLDWQAAATPTIAAVPAIRRNRRLSDSITNRPYRI